MDYIDSGVEWIGNIPNNWKIEKVKYNFKNTKEIVGIRVNNYERLALTLNGVVKRSKEDDNGLQPDNFETYQILRKNELVFKLIDLQNVSTSRIGLSNYEGIVSPAYIILKENGKVIPKYAELYFLYMWYFQVFNVLGDCGVRSSLNTRDLLNLPIPVPPKKVQERIIDYLENRINRIENVKENMLKQLDKLNEYKESLISNSVIYGLNRNAEMIESGIDYIGQMNSNWKLIRIGYICNKLQRGFDEEALALICSNKGTVEYRDDNSFGLVSDSDNSFQGVKKGDLLIHGMDTWHGAIAVSDKDGKCTKVVHVCDSKENKDFIKYYLQMLAYKKVYKAISNGVRENTSDFRSWDKANKIYITLPSRNEQNEIANYLNNKCKQIDDIVANQKKQIDILDKYKYSIIYEYITGKKEVPND